jgi:hypothetical protein
MRKPLWILGSVLAVAFLALGFRFAQDAKPLKWFEPLSFEEKVELTPEEREIKEAIIKGFRLLGYADFTLDYAVLEEAFVDDPRFPLEAPFHEKVKLAFGEVPEGAGWLTWLKARYILYREGVETLEAYERGEIGPEELREREKKGYEFYAKRPYLPDDEEVRSWFNFYDFKIENDVAEVVHRCGMRIVRTYLVKRDGKWFIAYMKEIGIAP